MNSAELALRLRKLHATGGLTGRTTPTLEAHWNRHVHLYTNPVFGTWHAEVALSLMQAQGYLAELAKFAPDSNDVSMLENVNDALGWL